MISSTLALWEGKTDSYKKFQIKPFLLLLIQNEVTTELDPKGENSLWQRDGC